MGRFAVIGLGKFGRHVARNLFERGHDVVGVDSTKERVQEMRDHATRSVVADCTDLDTLKALGISDCDAVIVSLGERMDASTLVTMYLKEMGVRRIVAKAVSPDHGKILSVLGATEVVHPERDTAYRVANALGARSVLEQLPLGVGFGLIEMRAPRSYHGRSLSQLEVRAKQHVQVVAIKNGDRLDLAPGGDYVVQTGDILVLIGRNADLTEITRYAG